MPRLASPYKQPTAMQIPNASSYFAQKLLIQEMRDSKERARHIVYIDDTIQIFGRSLVQLQDGWAKDVTSMLRPQAVASVMNSANVLFGEVTDTIRDASIEVGSTGRGLIAEELRVVCYTGLRQTFA
jgi:hypothetical protein